MFKGGHIYNSILYYGLILLFCLSHSLLAADRIKIRVMKIFPGKNFRLLYNLISFIFLGMIAATYRSLEHQPLFRWDGQIFVGWMLIAAGSVLSYISFKPYDTGEFLGLKEAPEKPRLSTGGMNRYVRHPLYSSGLIVLAGMILLEPTLHFVGFSIIITLYLVIGTRLEESKLAKEYGQEYRDYLQRVPMLIPRFRKKSRTSS